MEDYFQVNACSLSVSRTVVESVIHVKVLSGAPRMKLFKRCRRNHSTMRSQ